ncbi:unnamed protein product [Pleuronectes platessa]|uniref:USP domain-containing protein n=1 Tax=Pleuronectes platessa TaxID=8262 RepID=A0A9N7YXH7_PLEPL|nr:unnamed protein product [Pleuronectes platessa]
MRSKDAAAIRRFALHKHWKLDTVAAAPLCPEIFDSACEAFLLHFVHGPEETTHNINNTRELLVPSQQGTGWYSVVSFISHLGCSATSGHYVSAGVQRGAVPDDATDSWVIYDDNNVTNVTGESVLSHYQKKTYIFFYKRRD